MTQETPENDAQEHSEDIQPTDVMLDQDARLTASAFWKDDDSYITAIARAGGRYIYGILPIWHGRYWAGVRVKKEDMGWPLRSDHFETVVTTLLEKDALNLTWKAIQDDP